MQLADGTTSETPGTLTLPIRLGKITAHHNFGILPGMEDGILIGIDLMAKLKIAIPIPPLFAFSPQQKCSTARGLTDGSKEEQGLLQEFLTDELTKFENIQGPTDHVQHHIRLIEATPIKQRYRPRNPAMQTIIDNEVDELLKQGVIEPSHSPWSSPIVVVRKKDGKYRFCIDFRKVNVKLPIKTPIRCRK